MASYFEVSKLLTRVCRDSALIFRRNNIVKKQGIKMTGAIMQKKKLPVETDPEKLVNYVCGSNYLKEGEDIELKPDNEYPDWLWTLRTDGPIPLEELDPNTLQYWNKVRKINAKRINELKSLNPVK